MNNDATWEVIIIGGGAAGLSAALILARARRRVLVIDAQQPRNRFAPHMHGVLSRDGYSPLDLVADGYREVRAADGVIINASVTSSRAMEGGFEVTTDTGELLTAKHLVFATGARDELPGIPGLKEQWGRGVVACPYCDGYEARGRAIGVLAGSAMGLHKAHMLRSYSDNITVFVGDLPLSERLILEERGMRVITTPVTHVVSDGDRLTGVAHDDGTITAVEVVFADSTVSVLDAPMQGLGVDYTETPMGPWPTVDALGHTSVPGVWAIGNASIPNALVPMAAGSGVTTAVTLNSELVAAEVAAASARVTASHWNEHYIAHRGDSGRVWSGKVNAAVEREVTGLTPGTALELGCGEGADAIWLASQGWKVTAIDVSAEALAVAAEHGSKDIEWVQADLASWQPTQQYNLVTSAFLHSKIALQRDEILRQAAAAVAPGGQLLIVGHGEFPPGGHEHDGPPLPSSDEVLAALNLGEDWTVETNAAVDRPAIWRDGTAMTLVDAVLRVRRAG